MTNHRSESLRLDAIAGLDGVYRVGGDTVGYLIVRGGASLLIDCPAGDLGKAIMAAGLPLPRTILHTQVQAEHCHEHASLPAAAVVVAAAAREVALVSTAYALGCKTFWPPSREWDSRGAEEYGVAGCITERPPDAPLNVTATVEPGQTWTWQDVTLQVLALPGHGKRSLGFWWDAQRTLFSGDLMEAGGFLVNFYDIERSYGVPTGYTELRQSLITAGEFDALRWLPSTGAVITRPEADMAALRDRLAWVNRPPRRRPEATGTVCNFEPIRSFGRYKEILPGLYQNTNFGNVVLFVREDGLGLMIDPDFCVWESWEENVRQWHADLDLLERETGLKRVDRVLLTHYHGDHVEYADEMRARYGSIITATADVAEVCEQPRHFGYPAAIDWYNFPFDHVRVDERVPYERVFHWHDMAITAVHTPGHCNAHASFLMEWRRQQILVAGDIIQYGDGPIACPLPIMYNDNAWPERGQLRALLNIGERPIDYIVGGHSHCCHDPDGEARGAMLAVAHEALHLARRMVSDGDTMRAMTPPHYDAIRPDGPEVLSGTPDPGHLPNPL